MSMTSYDWLKQNKETDRVQQSMSHKATVGCACSYQGLENDVLLLQCNVLRWDSKLQKLYCDLGTLLKTTVYRGHL